jgi:hypothetical protein
METDVLAKLAEMDQKIDRMFKSVEKLRRYFLWTLIITLITIVLPLIALIFVAPWALDILSNAYMIQ